MANSTTHMNWFGPIRKARHTILITYLDADGDPTDPTTPDTEVSKDGGSFADCAEEATTVTGSNGTAYITLTGAETDCLALAVAAKVASGPKNTIATGPVKDYPIFATGTATAGAAGTITLAVGSVPIDDFYNGFIIRTTGGTGGGGTGGANNQARLILDYNGATRVATIGPANWETNPDSTTTYDLLRTEMAMNATLNNSSHGGSSAIVSLQQLTVTQTSSNQNAVTFTGNGTGAGLSCAGGATGNGLQGIGGGTSGSGAYLGGVGSGSGIYTQGIGAPGISSNGGTNAAGILATGNGTGAGLDVNGGATGAGFRGAGGGSGGAGMYLIGSGVWHGLIGVGGATGHGARFVGGATSGHGMSLESATSGSGLNVLGVAAAGFVSTGGTNSAGASFVGTGTGASLLASQGITGSITGSLSGSVGSVTGAVGSVTSGVTVTTNNDKTGYSLTQTFPSNFSALSISAGGVVASNVTHYGGSAGTFASGRPEVNMTHIAGATVNTATAQLGVNIVQAAGTAWGSGAITAASIADGAIDRATFAADTGLQTIRSDTATAGAAGTITLDGSASTTANAYTPCQVVITGGTGAGQVRLGTAYSTGRVLTVVPDWTTNPDATSTYALLPTGMTSANLTYISGSAVSTTTAQLGVNAVNWGGTAVGSANVRSNVVQWNSSAIATPDTAGYPKVTIKSGTGTGEVSLTSGIAAVNVTQFGGSAGTFSGGRPEVNMSHIAGAAVNTASAQLGVNIVNAAGTAWNSGAIGTSTIAAGAIDRATFAEDTGLQTIRSGTAQAGGAGSITLDAGASAADGYYVGYWVYTTGGTGSGQCRAITGYTGSTKVATTNLGWSVTPDNTTTFAIVPVAQLHADVRYFNGAEFPNDGSGAPMVTAGAWYGDGQANTFLSDGTGSPLPRVATSGWYDSANNQAYGVDLVDNGLGDYFPSVNTKLWAGKATQLDNNNKPAVSVAWWYDPVEDTNAALSLAASSYPKVDLASIAGDSGFVPNLNGFLEEGTITGSPIPANVTHVTSTSLSGANDVGAAFKVFFNVAWPGLTMNALETYAANAETNSAATQVIAAKLDTSLEVDGLVYRFTSNALEQAPTGGGGGPTASEIADEVETRTLLANLVQIDSASVTGGNGAQVAAAFVSFFDVATPALTVASVNQTGDSYARIGSNGSGLTALPWNAAWDTEVQSEVEDGLNALGFTTTVSGHIDAAISSRATDSGVWAVGGRTLTAATNITSSGQSINVLNKFVIPSDVLNSTTINAATNSQIFTLVAGPSTNNVYVGCRVTVRRVAEWEDAATGVCAAYNGSTKQITLQTGLVFTPASGDYVFVSSAQDQNIAKLAVTSAGGVTLADGVTHGGGDAQLQLKSVYIDNNDGVAVSINSNHATLPAVAISGAGNAALSILGTGLASTGVYIGGVKALHMFGSDTDIAIGGSSTSMFTVIADSVWDEDLSSYVVANSGAVLLKNISDIANGLDDSLFDGTLAAVKAKTDLLVTFPSNFSALTISGGGAVSANVTHAAGTAWGSGAITAGSLDAGAISAIQAGLATASAVATVDNVVDAILVDTAEIGVAGAGLTALAPAATALSTTVWTSTIAGRIDAAISSRATDAGVWTSGVRTLTSVSGLTIDANVSQIGGSSSAATLLKLQMQAVINGTVTSDGGNTSQSFLTSLTGEAANYFGDGSSGGAVLVFVSGANNQYQARRITGYASGVVTVESPFDGVPNGGDAFIILGRIES